MLYSESDYQSGIGEAERDRMNRNVLLPREMMPLYCMYRKLKATDPVLAVALIKGISSMVEKVVDSLDS